MRPGERSIDIYAQLYMDGMGTRRDGRRRQRAGLSVQLSLLNLGVQHLGLGNIILLGFVEKAVLEDEGNWRRFLTGLTAAADGWAAGWRLQTPVGSVWVRLFVLSYIGDLPQLAATVGTLHLSADTIAGFIWCKMNSQDKCDPLKHLSCERKTYQEMEDATTKAEKQRLGVKELLPLPRRVHAGDPLDVFTFGRQHLHAEGVDSQMHC